MTRKKRKSISRKSKVKRLQRKKVKGGSKTFGSLRQLGYNKAFRISSPIRPEELLKGIEKGVETEPQIETKPAQKAELKELFLLIADLATGLWRIDKKSATDGIDEATGSMRSLRRHVESTLDALTSARIEVHDHTGQKYVTGMALKVIAFQPTSAVQIEKIAETIKPSVFYKDQLIQRGEVIVETPEAKQSNLESKMGSTSEDASLDENEKCTENDK